MGNCYRFALETLLDLYGGQSSETVSVGADFFATETLGDSGGAWVRNLRLLELGDCPVLVHGFPVGKAGVVQGKKFGHAWLEGNGYVVDCGTHEKKHSLVSRERYYRLGCIDPSECHRYTIEQAAQHVLDTGTDGLWSEPPSDALTG
jgi:hypothetical protein